MSDQLYIESYLLLLKSTTEVYVHGTLESSNDKVHTLLKKALNDILGMQSDTYSEATSYGWYNVDNVDNSKIKDTINKLNSK